MKKRTKRSVTLIEIMIVILLIGMIGGALAFNMRGSVDEGKKFKTLQNIARVNDILMMEHAEGKSLDEVVRDRVNILKKSPLVKGGDKLLKDAWGNDLIIVIENDDLKITSPRL